MTADQDSATGVVTLAPLAGASGVGAAGPVGGGGGGGVRTVQPDRVATRAVAEPSLTSTVQSAGAVKPDRSIRNRPPESLRPMTTPSTVMSRDAVAVPSRRRFVPLSSARDTDTAADAGAAVT